MGHAATQAPTRTTRREDSMKALARSLLVILMIGLPAQKALSQSAPARVVTPTEYERWKKDLSNWGR